MEEGLRAARPFGDPPGFDFLVHHNGKQIVRVQVKTTTWKRGDWYSCTLKTCRKPYKKDSFDFVAAYLAPEDTWYILPEKLIRGMVSLGLNPKSSGSKYDRYKEAWHLLRGEKPGTVDRIQACAEQPVRRSWYSVVNWLGRAGPSVLAARLLRSRLSGSVLSDP
jgi:hypothetical protein